MSNAFSDKLPLDKPQDCMSRVISGTISSLVAGGMIGALTANWGDIPQVLQDKSLPALKRTGIAQSVLMQAVKAHLPSVHTAKLDLWPAPGGIMAKYGVTFAAIGLAFSGIDCAAETFRGDSEHPLKMYHAELPAASNLACSPCHVYKLNNALCNLSGFCILFCCREERHLEWCIWRCCSWGYAGLTSWQTSCGSGSSNCSGSDISHCRQQSWQTQSC